MEKNVVWYSKREAPLQPHALGMEKALCFCLASERDFSSPNLDSFRARWWCLRTVVLISQRCSCRFVSLQWRAVRGRAAIHWGGIVRQGSTERIPHPGLVTLGSCDHGAIHHYGRSLSIGTG